MEWSIFRGVFNALEEARPHPFQSSCMVVIWRMGATVYTVLLICLSFQCDSGVKANNYCSIEANSNFKCAQGLTCLLDEVYGAYVCSKQFYLLTVLENNKTEFSTLLLNFGLFENRNIFFFCSSIDQRIGFLISMIYL